MPARKHVLELVSLVEQLRIDEAIERFYADPVFMQDNHNPPTVGKAANRERERKFFGSVTVNAMEAKRVLVEGDHAAIHWLFDFTAADGKRFVLDQIAFQTWKGDRIVNERFVYDSASIAVDAA